MKSKRKCAPKARPKKQLEGLLQDSFERLVLYKYKWRYRENKVHGAFQMKHGGWINGCGTTGEADMTVYVPAGEGKHWVWHIEVKLPGENQSDAQIAWQVQVEKHGEIYTVCRSQEDVEAVISQKGWADKAPKATQQSLEMEAVPSQRKTRRTKGAVA